MKNAILSARLELQPCKQPFRNLGWSIANGSSGTIRTVRDVVQGMGWSDNGISAESLKQLRSALVQAGHVDRLAFPSLSEDRKPVFAGGVAILSAVFHALQIDRMLCSSGALREGLLYDLLGRIQHHDIRESTVQAMAERYHVDFEQARRVKDTALALVDKAAASWQLRREDARQWLEWAATLHEIGLVIAHSQYHKHGAYVLEHSDLPGFSVRDQRLLSALVRCHRRKVSKAAIEALPAGIRDNTVRLCLLLRLAVLLRRNRSDRALPDIEISIGKDCIGLKFEDGWLDEHPLTRGDLRLERKFLRAVGIQLEYR